MNANTNTNTNANTIKLYASTWSHEINGIANNLKVQLISKEGRRALLHFYSWQRTYYRTTNKRTGAPLKKAVVDHVTENALILDSEFYSIAEGRMYYDWADKKEYYINYLYDDCRRDLELEAQPREKDMIFNKENILMLINEVTGRNYAGIEIETEKNIIQEEPAEWAAIKEAEKAAAYKAAIDAEIERLAGITEKLMKAGKNINAAGLERFRKLEEFTGVTAADVARIEKLAKASGGYYEKNILASCGRLIIKESENSYKIYNLCQGNYFRVHENRITA